MTICRRVPVKIGNGKIVWTNYHVIILQCTSTQVKLVIPTVNDMYVLCTYLTFSAKWHGS